MRRTHLDIIAPITDIVDPSNGPGPRDRVSVQLSAKVEVSRVQASLALAKPAALHVREGRRRGECARTHHVIKSE